MIHPNRARTFRKDRAIVAQMEPARGVAAWGEWAAPDPREFLQVRSHDRYRNLIEWYLWPGYAELRSRPVAKTKMLSCVTSGKTDDPGQKLRIAFLQHLEASGMPIDIWGRDNIHGFGSYRGALPAYRKDDGIFPYRYTIAIENNAEPNYFTEKLADAILGECLCFYWGCPNLEEHIDPAAFIRLPLDDFELSLQIVGDAIRTGERERRLPAILREKARILDEYQVLPTLARVIHGHRFSEQLRVTCVSLERRADRRTAFLARLDASAGAAFAARCERFAATDGAALAMTPEIRHLFRGNDFNYRRGIVGCALSHLAIWRELAAGGQGQGPVLVFEDDAEPCPGFHGQLVEICGELADCHPDFDVVLLGFQFWDPALGQYATESQLPVHLRPMAWSDYLGGCFAYLISQAGARRLLEMADRNGIQQAIDWFIMNNGAALKVLQCVPQIVTSPLAVPGSAVDSDIQHDLQPVAGSD